ncbi:MAG: hypothetical protein UH249_07580 [Acutalibacteraceae bacterium]|nr:hypothetical protein [Acutalibacteraceae bacterium]
MANEVLLTNKIFLNAALPLLKVIANDVPSLAKKFEKVHCIYQVSALDPTSPNGKYATHFTVNNGEWKVCADKVATNAHIELEFKSMETMNAFFKGNIGPSTLPKMKGIVKKPVEFAAFMMVLLKMSSLLTITEAPADEETQKLAVKCFFYLLSSGISQLNKHGHEGVQDWAKKSPDRVYAWAVDGYPEVSAFLRVKAGKTRSGRGTYKRAMPFFTMRFDSLPSALGILLSTDDMLESTKKGKLIMDGAPEFGAQIGDFMMQVGDYAK